MAQASVSPHQQRIDNAQSKGKELIYGILIGMVLVPLAIWIGSALFSDTEGYLTNVFTEVISVIATIFVIDRINQWRDDLRVKDNLLAELNSTSTSPAVNALDRLRREGWLDEDYLVGKDLQRADWEGAYIGGMNFEGVNLRRANLKQVTNADEKGIQDVNFKDANLWAANLEGATLKYGKLEGANLLGARLEGAHLWAANLGSASLMSAKLEGADLWETKLEDANLWGANLKGAILYRANLESASLRTAKLEGAELRAAKLEGADLRAAKLDNVEWADADGSYPATLPDGTKWTEDEDMGRFTDENHPDYKATLEAINAIRAEQGRAEIT